VRNFWPIGEGAQADYEQLRAGVLAGTPLVSAAAGRFERTGLAGLILAPSAPAVFNAVLLGAARPSWSPYADPRHEALADGYMLVLGGVAAGSGTGTSAVAASGWGPL
jgi:hypothetical protein